MVDGEAAVKFGEGRDEEGAECVAKDVDGDDKGGEFFICGVEISHHFWDAGCEHGRCEGPVVLISNGLDKSGGAGPYVRKVMEETTAMLDHFSFSDQLMGFAGSLGPSQETIFGSTGSAG